MPIYVAHPKTMLILSTLQMSKASVPRNDIATSEVRVSEQNFRKIIFEFFRADFEGFQLDTLSKVTLHARKLSNWSKKLKNPTGQSRFSIPTTNHTPLARRQNQRKLSTVLAVTVPHWCQAETANKQ